MDTNLSRILLIVSQVLFVVAVPIFLVTLSLRIAVNSPRLYEYGFDRYSAVERTGLPKEDLVRAGREVIAYFNNSEKELRIFVNVNGVQQELFNQREITHMWDVKGLVRGVYLWQWISLGYILGYTLLGLALWRSRFWPTLARGFLWGSGVTIGGLIVLGLGMLAGFDALFTQYHLLRFSNDFWLLDPSRDKLIQMFPESFFRDATVFVVLEALFGALVLGGVAGAFLIRRKRPLRLWATWRESVRAEGTKPAG